MDNKGDVLLCDTLEGGDIVFDTYDVKFTPGLDNMVYIALYGGNVGDDGTRGNKYTWWGNYISSIATPYISRTQNILRTGSPLTTSTLSLLRSSVLSDLQFMLDSNIASNISVEVTSPVYNSVYIDININADGENININFLNNWQDSF